MNNSEKYSWVFELDSEDVSKQLALLDESTSREVYNLDDEFVLKVSKGLAGIEQNHRESLVYRRANKRIKSILCPVEYYDKNSGWIIMRKAISPFDISPSQIEKLLGTLTVEHIKGESYVTIRQFTENNHDILNELIEKFKLHIDDLQMLHNWGYLKDEQRFVLIDFGLTEKAYFEHYEVE